MNGWIRGLAVVVLTSGCSILAFDPLGTAPPEPNTRDCPVEACTEPGVRKCDGLGTVVACADLGADGCLAWGPGSGCESGLTCSNGSCRAQCENECSDVGSRTCEGSGFKVCEDVGGGCLHWSRVTACGAGESCSNGACATTCRDECTTAGAKSCAGNAVVGCGHYDADPCLEWGSPADCGAGAFCTSGACLPECLPECTAGARRCNEAGLVQACVERAGCLGWGTPSSCPTGEVCAAGQCARSCTDECDTADARRCTAGSTTQYEVCGEHDGDGCLEWGSPVGCPAGQVCAAGKCALSCTDECGPRDARRCAAGSTTRYETCGEYDGDGCLEWGGAQACPQGDVCGGSGECASACAGVTRCSGGDGCCPAGCNATSDADCQPVCGNGVTEAPEACDGNCPASCADTNACTTDALTGSAGTCSARCTHTAITLCVAGDGCCPAGCSSATDADCPPPSCFGGSVTCTWHIEQVDAEGGAYASLRLAESGALRIAYFDSTGYRNDLKYAAKNGSGWQLAVVDSAGSVGADTSLALDASGNPHVVYNDFTNSNMKYARNPGSGWLTEAAAAPGNACNYMSLALDASGNPHVSYQQVVSSGSEQHLGYASRTANGWQTETVDQSHMVGAYSSLALDASGAPRIAYRDDWNKSLKYAWKAPSGWQTETVDSSTVTGTDASLALDSSGNPHITYFDFSNRILKHAWKTTVWQTETVDSQLGSGRATSLAIDAGGTLHVSYYDESNGDLKYARKAGSSWQAQVVDAPGDVGSYTSLALDRGGNPHIAYYEKLNYTDGRLKYARLAP